MMHHFRQRHPENATTLLKYAEEYKKYNKGTGPAPDYDAIRAEMMKNLPALPVPDNQLQHHQQSLQQQQQQQLGGGGVEDENGLQSPVAMEQ